MASLAGEGRRRASVGLIICTGLSAPLDGVYTAFGRVVDGMAAVDAIEAAPHTGEAPNTRIELRTVSFNATGRSRPPGARSGRTR